MVKIKMIKTACGPFGSFMANSEYDVSSEVAEQLKSGDACVILRTVAAPEVEVAEEPEPPEVEVAEEPEPPEVEVAEEPEPPEVEVAEEPEPPEVEVAKVENKPKPKKAPAKFTPGK